MRSENFTYLNILYLNYVIVGVLCMGLWLLQTPSSLDFDGEIIDTVFIKNRTESLDISCREFYIFYTKWSIYSSRQWKTILDVFEYKNGSNLFYWNNYTAEKYNMSGSVNGSLEVKNIELSDAGYYMCSYGFIYLWHFTLLRVVGKLLLTYFVFG